MYRLCECDECGGQGKIHPNIALAGALGVMRAEVKAAREQAEKVARCPDCRGEGKTLELLATCASESAVGVTLCTLAREGEWAECPAGLLDRMPPCPECEGSGRSTLWKNGTPSNIGECPKCKGSGVKPTGTWLILPWLPSPRNASDVGRLLRSRRS